MLISGFVRDGSEKNINAYWRKMDSSTGKATPKFFKPLCPGGSPVHLVPAASSQPRRGHRAAARAADPVTAPRKGRPFRKGGSKRQISFERTNASLRSMSRDLSSSYRSTAMPRMAGGTMLRTNPAGCRQKRREETNRRSVPEQPQESWIRSFQWRGCRRPLTGRLTQDVISL